MLGSNDDLSRYAGTAEHAQKLKTYWDCFKCRNHIVGMLEMAAIETDPVERRRLLTFVIVGGNFGGVEVATELEDYLQLLTKTQYRAIRAEEPKVVLVHSGHRILPELMPHHVPLVEWAEKFLQDQRPRIPLQHQSGAATPDEVVLSTGERIATRTDHQLLGYGPVTAARGSGFAARRARPRQGRRKHARARPHKYLGRWRLRGGAPPEGRKLPAACSLRDDPRQDDRQEHYGHGRRQRRLNATASPASAMPVRWDVAAPFPCQRHSLHRADGLDSLAVDPAELCGIPRPQGPHLHRLAAVADPRTRRHQYPHG